MTTILNKISTMLCEQIIDFDPSNQMFDVLLI